MTFLESSISGFPRHQDGLFRGEFGQASANSLPCFVIDVQHVPFRKLAWIDTRFITLQARSLAVIARTSIVPDKASVPATVQRLLSQISSKAKPPLPEARTARKAAFRRSENGTEIGRSMMRPAMIVLDPRRFAPYWPASNFVQHAAGCPNR